MKNTFIIFAIFLCQSAFSQSFSDFRDYVKRNYNFKKNYDTKKNLYIDKNVVHIFVDHDGNLIETGFPTTATEKYSFKLHLITTTEVSKEMGFIYTYRGQYRPALNIQNESLSEDDAVGIAGVKTPNKIEEYVYATIGPFTNDFSINLKKVLKSDNSVVKELINTTIDVAKTFHVSISSGLYMTSLRNPTNIKQSMNQNDEITLIADDPNTRGLLSLNAVFYPKGRTFLFPPSGTLFSPERFGIIVGTQLNRDQFENFIGGIQFDFARGGSLSFGAHYGRRNIIAGYENFEFGVDKFDGNLNDLVVKNWGVGFIFGVNLDVRIFGQLFSTN